jgi:hypothetical protein
VGSKGLRFLLKSKELIEKYKITFIYVNSTKGKVSKNNNNTSAVNTMLEAEEKWAL